MIGLWVLVKWSEYFGLVHVSETMVSDSFTKIWQLRFFAPYVLEISFKAKGVSTLYLPPVERSSVSLTEYNTFETINGD